MPRWAPTHTSPADAWHVRPTFIGEPQLQLHQACIDDDPSLASAERYVDLYWPEATMVVHDVRDATFEGPTGLEQLYDYAHSVFPIHKMRHSVGTFVIDGEGDDARVEWRWVVNWKAEKSGTLSTGTYSDAFQKRDGEWKCLRRVSDIDPNWPADLFQPWVDEESCSAWVLAWRLRCWLRQRCCAGHRRSSPEAEAVEGEERVAIVA